MPCIAITRGGDGDFWKFGSLREADEHALVQYGDALLRDANALKTTFRPLELKRLALRLNEPKLADEVAAGKSVQALWDKLLSAARVPPGDPAEVLKLVSEDRKKTRANGVTQRQHPTEVSEKMSDQEATTEKKTRAPRAAKFSAESVIGFGTDKEGKSYGPDNNPKRPGSQAHTRFGYYKSGQTVQEALDAGVTRADLNWDAKMGFITLN